MPRSSEVYLILLLIEILPAHAFTPSLTSLSRTSTRFVSTPALAPLRTRSTSKLVPVSLFKPEDEPITQVRLPNGESKSKSTFNLNDVKFDLGKNDDLPLFEGADVPNEDRVEVEVLLRPCNLVQNGCRSILEMVEDVARAIKNTLPVQRRDPNDLSDDLAIARKRVVVVGSGWGAHAMTKILEDNVVDVVVVSPRRCVIVSPRMRNLESFPHTHTR